MPVVPSPEAGATAVLESVRWQRLMQACGCMAATRTLLALVSAYAEKHRHYHTAVHIAACLRLLDAHAALAERPQEIELALWFHDAVYRPLAGGNEQKSADWARRFLTENGAPAEAAERVHAMIMATRHDIPARTPDESLLLDIDLAILGEDAETYDVYEAAIGKEYRMVPTIIYRRKRVEVLEAFLRRPAIYLTAAFRNAREERARANLARAIARLSA